MKIALANNLYYPFNRGGAETVVKKMITDLKAQGHEIFLITAKPRKEETPPKTDLKIYYLPSRYFQLSQTPIILKIIWHIGNIFSLRKTRAIKNILQTEKPELILTHNLMGLGFLLPRAIKKLKIRHEHYLHDIQLLHPSGLLMFGREKIVDSLAAKIYQLFTRAFFASPAKVISPSDWLLEQHRQRGFFRDSKTEVKNLIANETAPLKNILPAKNRPRQNFLFVGQIENHKGIFLVLSAFQKALLVKPEIKLIIVGNGRCLEKAKKLAENTKQIEFLGRLENKQIETLMTTSDCLIIPSLCYENAPMTIFEAQAVNHLVIAANIGGVPEIINPNDKLFNPGDSEDLRRYILGIN
jgi:glycosyltransferase involved in cell wall biosynthesis